MAIRYLDETLPVQKARIRYIEETPQKVSTKLFDDKFIRENKHLGIIIDVAGQTGSAFLNQLLLGLPVPLLKKAGIEIGEPVTIAGKVGEVVGGIAGFALGLPVKAGLKVGQLSAKLIPAVARSRALKYGIEGAVSSGLATSPQISKKIEEKGFAGVPAIKERAVAGVVGFGTGAIIGKIMNIIKSLKNVKNPDKLAERVRGQLFESKKIAGQKFANALDVLTEQNPDVKISLRGPFENLKQEIQLTPKVRAEIESAIKRTQRLAPQLEPKGNLVYTRLGQLLDHPEQAENLTLRDSQDIINTIKKTPTLRAKLPQGRFAKWEDVDFPLLDFVDDVKSAQLDAFPEMANVKKDYGTILGNYNKVKNLFKEGRLIGNMEKNFGDKEIQNSVAKVLPQETIDEVGGYRNSLKWLKWSKIALGLSAAGAGIDIGVRKIIK